MKSVGPHSNFARRSEDSNCTEFYIPHPLARAHVCVSVCVCEREATHTSVHVHLHYFLLNLLQDIIYKNRHIREHNRNQCKQLSKQNNYFYDVFSSSVTT